SKEDLTMGLTFQIAEAPRVYVEKIDVNGNTLTQDKVIRREFRLAEGDAFNSLQVKRSTARINSLGYFQEKFEVQQKPGSAPDRIILEANVEEKPTGQLQLSAGYSSLEKLIFQGSIEQRNFRGRGQTIGLNLAYSQYSKQVDVSFTEPYVFDKNVSLGLNVYRRDLNSFNYLNSNRNTIYQQATTGFQARVGIPVTEFISAIGSYTFNYDDVSVDKTQYYSTRADGSLQCDPLLAGRYLCEALGKRTSSILGISLVYDSLDNRIHPSRGRSASVSFDFAGLGGSVKYGRVRANVAQYKTIGKGFIFSLRGEGGAIVPWSGGNGTGPGPDAIRLTDRFYLGEPQIRGFDIRGVGPRIIRQFIIDDPANPGHPKVVTDRNQVVDDALGGRYYYLGHAELEIPLGSGAKELGLRPSIFVDAGAVWGVREPIREGGLQTFPNGTFIATRNANGDALYTQIDTTTLTGTTCTVTAASTVTSATNTNVLACLPTGAIAGQNTAIGQTVPPFQEVFLGNSPKPRISVGIGVNWNSPFGPFRIDFAKTLLKVDGDDTKAFTFNVGTQF
ncbi:MAG: outer membrane protein assembly factor BamA, partial [Novosphingobium sp.]